jgi:hypothetical protein
LPFAEESSIIQRQSQTEASISSIPFNHGQVLVQVSNLPNEGNLQSTINIEQLENLNLSNARNDNQELSDVPHLLMPKQVEEYTPVFHIPEVVIFFT